jgi:hypothetical protein
MTALTPQYATLVKGDVLVNQTACGVDLNALWDEFRDLLDVWNKERTGLTDPLVFDTTVSAEAVPQNGEVASFEEATGLGVPEVGQHSRQRSFGRIPIPGL